VSRSSLTEAFRQALAVADVSAHIPKIVLCGAIIGYKGRNWRIKATSPLCKAIVNKPALAPVPTALSPLCGAICCSSSGQLCVRLARKFTRVGWVQRADVSWRAQFAGLGWSMTAEPSASRRRIRRLAGRYLSTRSR